MAERPSFIVFITDQHRADFLGCYGHPHVQTPNIDAIAERGLLFERFYVSSPVCMPNRASFMTGRWPTSHGVRLNGLPLDRRQVTFVDLLRAAGYRTALIGKSHLQNFTRQPPMMPPPEPRPGYFRAGPPLVEAIRSDYRTEFYKQEEQDRWYANQRLLQTPFYGFEHVELVTGHGDNVGGDYIPWLKERLPDARQHMGAENQLEHTYRCPQAVRTALPEECYSTTYIAERAEAWLSRHAGSGEPFFLMVSFPDPHHPFNPPGRFWSMYDPELMPVPEAFTRNDWTPPPHVAGMIEQRANGQAKLGGMGTISCSAREAQEAQALTCGMITMVDEAVGRVRASAGASEAIQIFTADHGDHLGDHRLLLKGAEHYEQVTRVPFIWAEPDESLTGRSACIGQTHDIGPTILERALIEKAVGMQGRSVFLEPRQEAFIQYDHQKDNPAIGIGPRVHTLRRGQWRLSAIAGADWGELYDLKADPGEFVNLWDSPKHAADKQYLIHRLLQAELAAIDRVPLPTALA